MSFAHCDASVVYEGASVGLVPGEGNDNEAPPTQTGRIWFLRSCVGLAFALWSTALAQPLAEITGHCSDTHDWGVIQTNQVYPFTTGHAPPWASWFVGLTFLAIIMAGVAVGTLSFEDKGARLLADGLSFAVGLWCFFGGVSSVLRLVFPGTTGDGCTPSHVTPLAGTWLIWIAMALLGVVVRTDTTIK
jgi:hypothetical protein